MKLDEDYQRLYSSENRIASLTKYFTSIAIIISYPGLFGLTAFTAQKCKKEISIRKVVGASVTSITTMLSIDFLKLVLLSCVIAFPIAWTILSK
jgi:putative ABC transport system permease protein